MPRQIQGSQWDFSFGEVDPDLKRADNHPARKAGLRQMENARIKNSGTFQNRPGRSALFPVASSDTRTEEFTISAGHDFKITFGTASLKIFDSSGLLVATFLTQGNGAALPWTGANTNQIVYAILGMSIYICFGHGMRPQVVAWDGVSTWSIADFTELLIGNQKRTPFYRISPQGITLFPSAQTGAITITASSPVFTPAWVNMRIRFVGRQILISGYTSPTSVSGIVEEALPGGQGLSFAVDPRTVFSIGDVVIGSATGSKGIVTASNSTSIVVQLLSQTTTTVSNFNRFEGGFVTVAVAFTTADAIAGPSGSLQASTIGPIINPQPCSIWDDEVMNDMRGYPASCFSDQFRLGFCDFPSVPGGIGWSEINTPTDLYVGPNADNAIFEIAPAKLRVLYVVPGPESSEFIFCDRRVYYIPISPTNPLRPGSVAFQIVSGDGCAPVQPRLAQEAILYANAGRNSMMAIIATGAYYRPFNTKNLSDYHAHLFNNIQAIAAPNADGQFNERYAYVLNGDGSIACGKYKSESLAGGEPVIGWVPWSGAGTVKWIAAWDADVLFTTQYFGSGICEILDDSVYLDAALFVNALPAPFAAPGGKGPLWWIPSQTVSLMDQVTRNMGTYQIDGNGFIVPQGNGGENLALASLVAGQPWTMTAEPFAPDAQPGADMGQRMKKRQFSYFAAYVMNSTGFSFANLFSSQQLPTSPALGTVTNTRDVPAYNMGDDATKPPTLRETVETYAPTGSSFDPRAAIIKSTPGPLLIAEIAMEITI